MKKGPLSAGPFFLVAMGETMKRAVKMTVQSAIKLVVVLVVVLAVFLVPLEVRAMAGNDDPVMKRAVDAGVDAERLERLANRGQSRGMTPDQLQQILLPVVSLAEMDLPYDLVMQKAAEGLAKQVPAPGILLVLDHMQGSMVRSVTIVDPWMARPEVQHMMEAKRGAGATAEATGMYRGMLLESASHSLQNNVDEDVLREFLEKMASTDVMTRGGLASVAAGLQALSEMPMTRENPGLSIRLLIGAMNAGFTTSEIRELPHALRSAQFNSRLPMERIAWSKDMQRYENIPAVQMMEYLFQGNIGGGPVGFQTPDVPRDRESERDRNRMPPLPPLP